MSNFKKFISRGLFGITLGVFINQLVYMIMAVNGSVVSISFDTVISQFTLSCIAGFYFTGVSIIFGIEEWSLLRQTVTHSIAMLPYFPLAIYAGWMPQTLIGRAFFILNYVIVYVIVWMSIKRYWKRKATELNKELSRIK